MNTQKPSATTVNHALMAIANASKMATFVMESVVVKNASIK